jgi:hypothetical protein
LIYLVKLRIGKRIQQHLKGRIKSVKQLIYSFKLKGGVNELRVLEQFVIEELRDRPDTTLTNSINSIAIDPKSINSRELRKIVNKLRLCK